MADEKSFPDPKVFELAIGLETKLNELQAVVKTLAQTATFAKYNGRPHVLVPVKTFIDMGELLGLSLSFKDTKGTNNKTGDGG